MDSLGGGFVDVSSIRVEMSRLQDLFSNKLMGLLTNEGYTEVDIQELYTNPATLSLMRIMFQTYVQGALDATQGTRDEKKVILPVTLFLKTRLTEDTRSPEIKPSKREREL